MKEQNHSTEGEYGYIINGGKEIGGYVRLSLHRYVMAYV